MLNKGMLLVRKPKTYDVVVERVTLQITTTNTRCTARVQGSKVLFLFSVAQGFYITVEGVESGYINSQIRLRPGVRPPAAIEIFGKLSPIIPNRSNPALPPLVKGEVIPLTTPAGTMGDVEIKYYYDTLPSS